MTDEESIILTIQMLMKTGKLSFHSVGALAFAHFEGKYRGRGLDLVISGPDLQTTIKNLLVALKNRKD